QIDNGNGDKSYRSKRRAGQRTIIQKDPSNQLCAGKYGCKRTILSSSGSADDFWARFNDPQTILQTFDHTQKYMMNDKGVNILKSGTNTEKNGTKLYSTDSITSEVTTDKSIIGRSKERIGRHRNEENHQSPLFNSFDEKNSNTQITKKKSNVNEIKSQTLMLDEIYKKSALLNQELNNDSENIKLFEFELVGKKLAIFTSPTEITTNSPVVYEEVIEMTLEYDRKLKDISESDKQNKSSEEIQENNRLSAVSPGKKGSTLVTERNSNFASTYNDGNETAVIEKTSSEYPSSYEERTESKLLSKKANNNTKSKTAQNSTLYIPKEEILTIYLTEDITESSIGTANIKGSFELKSESEKTPEPELVNNNIDKKDSIPQDIFDQITMSNKATELLPLKEIETEKLEPKVRTERVEETIEAVLPAEFIIAPMEVQPRKKANEKSSEHVSSSFTKVEEFLLWLKGLNITSSVPDQKSYNKFIEIVTIPLPEETTESPLATEKNMGSLFELLSESDETPEPELVDDSIAKKDPMLQDIFDTTTIDNEETGLLPSKESRNELSLAPKGRTEFVEETTEVALTVKDTTAPMEVPPRKNGHEISPEYLSLSEGKDDSLFGYKGITDYIAVPDKKSYAESHETVGMSETKLNEFENRLLVSNNRIENTTENGNELKYIKLSNNHVKEVKFDKDNITTVTHFNKPNNVAITTEYYIEATHEPSEIKTNADISDIKFGRSRGSKNVGKTYPATTEEIKLPKKVASDINDYHEKQISSNLPYEETEAVSKQTTEYYHNSKRLNSDKVKLDLDENIDDKNVSYLKRVTIKEDKKMAMNDITEMTDTTEYGVNMDTIWQSSSLFSNTETIDTIDKYFPKDSINYKISNLAEIEDSTSYATTESSVLYTIPLQIVNKNMTEKLYKDFLKDNELTDVIKEDKSLGVIDNLFSLFNFYSGKEFPVTHKTISNDIFDENIKVKNNSGLKMMSSSSENMRRDQNKFGISRIKENFYNSNLSSDNFENEMITSVLPYSQNINLESSEMDIVNNSVTDFLLNTKNNIVNQTTFPLLNFQEPSNETIFNERFVLPEDENIIAHTVKPVDAIIQKYFTERTKMDDIEMHSVKYNNKISNINQLQEIIPNIINSSGAQNIRITLKLDDYKTSENPGLMDKPFIRHSLFNENERQFKLFNKTKLSNESLLKNMEGSLSLNNESLYTKLQKDIDKNESMIFSSSETATPSWEATEIVAALESSLNKTENAHVQNVLQLGDNVYTPTFSPSYNPGILNTFFNGKETILDMVEQNIQMTTSNYDILSKPNFNVLTGRKKTNSNVMQTPGKRNNSHRRLGPATVIKTEKKGPISNLNTRTREEKTGGVIHTLPYVKNVGRLNLQKNKSPNNINIESSTENDQDFNKPNIHLSGRRRMGNLNHEKKSFTKLNPKDFYEFLNKEKTKGSSNIENPATLQPYQINLVKQASDVPIFNSNENMSLTKGERSDGRKEYSEGEGYSNNLNFLSFLEAQLLINDSRDNSTENIKTDRKKIVAGNVTETSNFLNFLSSMVNKTPDLKEKNGSFISKDMGRSRNLSSAINPNFIQFLSKEMEKKLSIDPTDLYDVGYNTSHEQNCTDEKQINISCHQLKVVDKKYDKIEKNGFNVNKESSKGGRGRFHLDQNKADGNNRYSEMIDEDKNQDANEKKIIITSEVPKQLIKTLNNDYIIPVKAAPKKDQEGRHSGYSFPYLSGFLQFLNGIDNSSDYPAYDENSKPILKITDDENHSTYNPISTETLSSPNMIEGEPMSFNSNISPTTEINELSLMEQIMLEFRDSPDDEFYNESLTSKIMMENGSSTIKNKIFALSTSTEIPLFTSVMVITDLPISMSQEEITPGTVISGVNFKAHLEEGNTFSSTTSNFIIEPSSTPQPDMLYFKAPGTVISGVNFKGHLEEGNEFSSTTYNFMNVQSSTPQPDMLYFNGVSFKGHLEEGNEFSSTTYNFMNVQSSTPQPDMLYFKDIYTPDADLRNTSINPVTTEMSYQDFKEEMEPISQTSFFHTSLHPSLMIEDFNASTTIPDL
ncbi:unnamed protein product, partial [Meganyctiphanes norvegica]